MIVVPQMFENAELTEDGNGQRYTLGYDCQDIVADNLIQMMYKAMTEAGENGVRVPQRGEPSPDVPGLFALNRRATPWPSVDVRVIVTFGPPVFSFLPQDTVLVEGGASITQIQTELDRNGHPIIVDWKPDGARQWRGKQTGSAPKYITTPQIRIVRVEEESPEWELDELVGKRNSASWRDHPAGAWMYSDCNFGNEQGRSDRWRVERAFVADIYDHFEPIARWIDPLTGRPPDIKDPEAALAFREDGHIGNGIRRVDNLYFDFDFGAEFGF